MKEDFLVIDTSASSRVQEEVILPLPIYTDGHEKLSESLKEFDVEQLSQPAIQKFIKQLKLTMKTYNGLGLSANQCGFNFRMFVMGSDEFQMVCINPRIIDVFDEPVKMREGCLSFPGMFLNVPRYNRIQVEFTNEAGEVINTLLEGISSQVYQHELDHMNGIVYTEKVGPLSLQMAKKRQAKLIRKITRKK